MEDLWMYGALYVVIAFVIGMMAANHGRNFWLYFGLSLIATPLFGYLMFLLFRPNQSRP